MIWRVLLLLAGATVSGATYFVDYGSGSDSNAGTSTGAAWQHIPGDDRATGSAAITLSSGDVVVLRGGVAYAHDSTSVWRLNSSGVTIRSGHLHSPQWGTDRAEVDLAASVPSNDAVDGAWYLSNYQDATIEGIRFRDGPAYDDSYCAAIAWRGTGGTHSGLLVQDCVFTNIVESAVYVVGSWDAGTFSDTVTVQNCEFYDIGTHGVFLRYGLRDCHVYTNTFRRIGTRSASPAPGGDPVGVFGHDSPSWNKDLVVRGNDMADIPIKSYVILSDQTVGALIEKNILWGTNGYSGFDLNGRLTNGVIRNNSIDMEVENFYGPIAMDTDQGTTAIDGLQIHNNTIRAATPNVGLVFFGRGNSGTTTPAIRNVDIRNNVLTLTTASRSVVYIEADSGGGPIADLDTITLDFNAYGPNGNSTPFHLAGTSYSLAGWRALGHGWDANSKEGVPTYASGFGALDGADTVARDAGFNLQSYFQTDILGTTRAGLWDVGAYDYATPPSSSANVTAATVGTLSIQ